MRAVWAQRQAGQRCVFGQARTSSVRHVVRSQLPLHEPIVSSRMQASEQGARGGGDGLGGGGRSRGGGGGGCGAFRMRGGGGGGGHGCSEGGPTLHRS